MKAHENVNDRVEIVRCGDLYRIEPARVTISPSTGVPNMTKPTARAIIRYIVLGLVELVVVILVLVVVRYWVAISDALFWGLVAVWLAKDVVLFPFVWRAYDQHAPSAAGAMVGERGIAKGRLDPSGYVQVRGELWQAKREGAGSPIEAGARVRVRRMEGLTLYVTPEDGTD